MSSTTHQAPSTAAVLYVALELSAKEWLLTMSTSPTATRPRARAARRSWRGGACVG